MAKIDLIKAIAATAELCGARLTEAGASMLVNDLSQYPEGQVVQALSIVRRSQGRFSLGAIIDAMESKDGRPGADEAWAMIPQTERDTTIWTDEMSKAWGVARPLLDMGDKIAARMAFKDAYNRMIAEARESGAAVRWQASLGLDPNSRVAAVQHAVAAGRISAEHAALLLPAPDMRSSPIVSLLTGPGQSQVDREMAKANLSILKNTMKRVKAA
jgi:hypothetical protein